VSVRATVYIATSLDGYIARPDGNLDWLLGATPVPGEDYGYQAFMDTVDVIVMGRATYEKVLSFGGWPYGGKQVVVLASRPVAIGPERARDVEWLRGEPETVLRALADRGLQHAYVDGGVTVQRFLAAGLVQRLIVTRVPVLIGAGVPLFGSLPRDVPLRHVGTRSWPNGFVQSEYATA
jgi:dihydrofolate reductase